MKLLLIIVTCLTRQSKAIIGRLIGNQIICGNKEQRANAVYWGLVGKPSDQRSRTKGLRARTGFLKPDRISNIVSESLSRMVPSLQ